MRKFPVFMLAVVFTFILAGCENSQPKKTADNQAVETQAPDTAVSTGRTIRPPSAQLAPDFTLTDIHGKTMKLSAYKGKVIILDFWATWCPPCKAEIPFFIELEEQYKKQGLAVLGVSLDNGVSKVKSFYNNTGMNYPVAMASPELSMLYGGIQGIPTTFIIDREGYIRDQFVGFRPKQVFEEAFLSLK
jgi:peroxiredoxin